MRLFAHSLHIDFCNAVQYWLEFTRIRVWFCQKHRYLPCTIRGTTTTSQKCSFGDPDQVPCPPFPYCQTFLSLPGRYPWDKDRWSSNRKGELPLWRHLWQPDLSLLGFVSNYQPRTYWVQIWELDFNWTDPPSSPPKIISVFSKPEALLLLRWSYGSSLSASS